MHAPLLLLFLLSIFLFTDADYYFAQSAPFTGPTSDLGVQMRLGILTAFHEVNSKGGVNGQLVQLISTDDQYEPIPCAANTRQFLNNANVLALVGYVGTPTSNAALTEIGSTNIAFVGPFTGGRGLRNTKPNIINIRSSYDDETQAMVRYLLLHKLITRISVFYQDDAFGLAGYNGLVRALGPHGISIESEGKYPRNTEDIEAGIESIAKGIPQAIVMIGTYHPLAKFVNLVKADHRFRKDITFLTVSFVGPDSFASHLGNNSDNVIVTQVVPPYADTSLKISKAFQKALTAYNATETPTVVAMEGYIVGSLVYRALKSIVGNITRQTFMNEFYETSIFTVNDVRFGPFTHCSINMISCSDNCNQGSSEVWPTSYTIVNGYPVFKLISEAYFSWSTCISDPTTTPTPIVFAMTLNASDTAAMEKREIIEVEFEGWNAENPAKRPLKLLVLDDNGESQRIAQNTADFLDVYRVFGLVGFSENASRIALPMLPASVPFIAPDTGSDFFTSTFRRNVINVKVSNDHMVAATIDYLVEEALTPSFCVLYTSDYEHLYETMRGALQHMHRKISFESEFTALNFAQVARSLLKKLADSSIVVNTGIIILADASLASLISYEILAANPKVHVAVLSTEPLARIASQFGRPEYISQIRIVSPYPSLVDSNFNTVAEFASEYNNSRSYAKFEGFLIGHFVAKVVEDIKGIVSRESFLKMLYSKHSVDIHGWYTGSFWDTCISGYGINAGVPQQCKCNLGSSTTFMLTVDEQHTLHPAGKIESDRTNCNTEAAEILIHSLILLYPITTSATLMTPEYQYFLGMRRAFEKTTNKDIKMHIMPFYAASYSESDIINLANETIPTYNIFGILMPPGNEKMAQMEPAVASFAKTHKYLMLSYSGVMSLRHPYNRYVLNPRNTHRDEFAAMYAFITEQLKFSKLGVLYPADNQYWTNFYDDMLEYCVYLEVSPHVFKYYMNNAMELEYIFSTDFLENTAKNTVSKELEVLIVLGKPEILAYFIPQLNKALARLSYSVKIVLSSETLLHDIETTLGVNGNSTLYDFSNVYQIQSVPYVNESMLQQTSSSKYSDFIKTYSLELIQESYPDGCSFNSYSLEGYTTGLIINQILSKIQGGVDSQDIFLDAAYKAELFTLDAMRFGPIGFECSGSAAYKSSSCDCNSLLRQSFAQRVVSIIPLMTEDVEAFYFKFSGCGVPYAAPGPNVLAIVITILGAAIVVLVAIVIFIIAVRIYLTIKRRRHAPFSGEMAIVFTDIQNSTKLWKKNPKGMKIALNLHNQVLRDLIKKYNGYEVKTVGDSFMVAFKSAENAVMWALEAQEELLIPDWPGDILSMKDCRMEWDEMHGDVTFRGVRVRIGMHWGTADRITDGGKLDYFGTTVNKAARIEALAAGGQTLISEAMFLKVKPLLDNKDVQRTMSMIKRSEKRAKVFASSEKGSMKDSHTNLSVHQDLVSPSTRSHFSGSSFSSFVSKRYRISSHDYFVHRYLGTFSLKGLDEKENIYEINTSRLKVRKCDIRARPEAEPEGNNEAEQIEEIQSPIHLKQHRPFGHGHGHNHSHSHGHLHFHNNRVHPQHSVPSITSLNDLYDNSSHDSFHTPHQLIHKTYSRHIDSAELPHPQQQQQQPEESTQQQPQDAQAEVGKETNETQTQQQVKEAEQETQEPQAQERSSSGTSTPAEQQE